MRLDLDLSPEPKLVEELLDSVIDTVKDLLRVGATHIVAEQTSPEPGERARVLVTSDVAEGPRFVVLKDGG